MRRAFAILLIGVFLLAQYGNVLSYVYCKWKAETTSASCDCEKKYSEDTKNSDYPEQISLKEKPEDPFIKSDLLLAGGFSKQISSCSVNRSFLLAKGFKSSPLHPPAII